MQKATTLFFKSIAYALGSPRKVTCLIGKLNGPFREVLTHAALKHRVQLALFIDLKRVFSRSNTSFVTVNSTRDVAITLDQNLVPSAKPYTKDGGDNVAIPRYMLNEAEYIRTFGLSH